MRELLVLITASALLLSGCSGTAGNTCGILAKRPSTDTPKNLLTQSEHASYCVEHWAARLARNNSVDPGVDIARAATHACSGAITRLGKMANDAFGDASTLERSIDMEGWRNQALFIVMQVRSADCYKDA